jgi:prevent-host-death family protein
MREIADSDLVNYPDQVFRSRSQPHVDLAAMTEIVNLYDAKARLSHLIDRATAGEEIVIGRAGKPLVRLVPVDPRRPREPGLLKGLVVADSLFDALPDDEQALWE